MTAAPFLWSREDFLCPICLDLFTAPVTIPCGHSFCKDCIVEKWRANERWQCPVCKKCPFNQPELHVNTFMSEIAAEFRQSALSPAAEQPGAVPCDLCIGYKSKALKSCVVCVSSFCGVHLKRHQVVPALSKHKLIDPLVNLENRICSEHDELMELFCRTDKTCVCQLCAQSTDHESHEVIPLGEEYQNKMTQLGEIEKTFHQMVKDRRQKVQELQYSASLSKIDADTEMENAMAWFTAFMSSVHSAKSIFVRELLEKRTTGDEQREDFIRTMNQEIMELTWRNSEVKHLLQSEDDPLLLQRFHSLTTSLPVTDLANVSLYKQSFEGILARSLSNLKASINKMLDVVLKDELNRVQQYAADITLDPDTAHCKLKLSEDGKQVSHSDAQLTLPDNKERFSPCVMVLAKQSFSSGRFYYEVDVEGKTKWDLGVTRASANRKGLITASPENGYWTLQLRDTNDYAALANPDITLCVKSQPQKLGIFVDYEEGIVSFYDVTNVDLMFSFTGCLFNDKLHPFFGPGFSDGGGNSAPLRISPMQEQ